MKTVIKPRLSLKPNRSVKTNKSLRPPKSLTGYNFMKTILTSPIKIFGILSVCFICSGVFYAHADEYVRMVCTNHYGQVNFDQTLSQSTELQLNQQKLFIPSSDQVVFNQAVEFLTSIQENKRNLSHRQKRFRRPLDCQMGYCQYTHGITDFDANQNPVQQTSKARFCANNGLAVQIRNTLLELAKYKVSN